MSREYSQGIATGKNGSHPVVLFDGKPQHIDAIIEEFNKLQAENEELQKALEALNRVFTKYRLEPLREEVAELREKVNRIEDAVDDAYNSVLAFAEKSIDLKSSFTDIHDLRKHILEILTNEQRGI